MKRNQINQIITQVNELRKEEKQIINKFILNSFWYPSLLLAELDRYVLLKFQAFKEVYSNGTIKQFEMMLMEDLFQTNENENPRFPCLPVTKELHQMNLKKETGLGELNNLEKLKESAFKCKTKKDLLNLIKSCIAEPIEELDEVLV